MTDALTAGALASRSELTRAAVHLLTGTGLPGRGDFARHTTLAWTPDPVGKRTLTAQVDLAAVRDDDTLHLTGSDEKLLTLALGYSHGRPVHLDAYLNSFGHQTARRVLEAHLIGMGMEGFLTVTAGGPELDKLHALHAELGIGDDA
ncbi:hypothetical protein AT728_16565 [Streptomyces silvensis]|uniref:Uncharacterized protein n=2 Tax=Streptomyces silvensis TaxID=1765722 RepID=A0A0W7X3X0_9ACTN|nr:hypothetical protein AT728_16565 [Streptomyces silvensis]